MAQATTILSAHKSGKSWNGRAALRPSASALLGGSRHRETHCVAPDDEVVEHLLDPDIDPETPKREIPCSTLHQTPAFSA